MLFQCYANECWWFTHHRRHCPRFQSKGALEKIGKALLRKGVRQRRGSDKVRVGSVLACSFSYEQVVSLFSV